MMAAPAVRCAAGAGLLGVIAWPNGKRESVREARWGSLRNETHNGPKISSHFPDQGAMSESMGPGIPSAHDRQPSGI